MRCPKCDFVSFDLLESCVKCGKNISEAAKELAGTVVGVGAPSFLKVAGVGTASEKSAGIDTEESLDLGVEGEEESMDFSFDDESSVETESEAVEMDLGEIGDEEADAEIDLGAEETPDFDFGVDEEEAIGISDLAPADESDEVQLGEFVEEVETEVATAGAGRDLEIFRSTGLIWRALPV